MSTWTDLESARTVELKRKARDINVTTIPAMVAREFVFFPANGRDSLSWSLIGLLVFISGYRYFLVRDSKRSPLAWQRENVALALAAGISWGNIILSRRKPCA